MSRVPEDNEILLEWLRRPEGESLRAFSDRLGWSYDAVRQRKSRNPSLKQSMSLEVDEEQEPGDPDLALERAMDGAEEEAVDLGLDHWHVRFIRAWLVTGKRESALEFVGKTWADVRSALNSLSAFETLYADARAIIVEATSAFAEDQLATAAKGGNGTAVKKWLEAHDPRYRQKLHLVPDQPKAMAPEQARLMARQLLTGGEA